MKEAEALTVAAFKEKVWAQEEREKAVTISKKFYAFVGFAGDVVTKARLYDECMKKPEVVPVPKILRMLVDFSGKVEKLLGELHILLQDDGRGQEAGPSERRPESDSESVSRPEPTSPPASTLGVPATGEASGPTPQPEAPENQLKPAATPMVPDPIHQEPIPDSLNTDDIPSLHQWATEGLLDTVTPTT